MMLALGSGCGKEGLDVNGNAEHASKARERREKRAKRYPRRVIVLEEYLAGMLCGFEGEEEVLKKYLAGMLHGSKRGEEVLDTRLEMIGFEARSLFDAQSC